MSEGSQHNTLSAKSEDNHELCVGFETLAKWTDGMYYLGSIAKIDHKKHQCLINFENGEKFWCSIGNILTERESRPSLEITCCLCKEGESEPPNEIVLCDNCGLGYHQFCHNPQIETTVLLPDIEWLCRLCTALGPEKRQRSGSVSSDHSYSQDCASTPDIGLPYIMNKLHWDVFHLTNKENKYCYCGKGGFWYRKMLECRRCCQWFHEECISSLKQPLIWGDRYYVFVCLLCNRSNKEYVRRLDIKWDEIVHLALFELTMGRHIKYFDINEVIIPWIIEKWDQFQLPKNIHNTPLKQIEQFVLKTMSSNPGIFKNGKEIKKRFTWWGLRERYPPPPPIIAPLAGNATVTCEMVDLAISRGSNVKVNKKITEIYPFIPFCLASKRKASTDPSDLGQKKAKKPRKLSIDKKSTSKQTNDPSPNQEYKGYNGDTQSYSMENNSVKETLKNINNNNNDSPAKISLDHIIPCPSSFDGFNHPFKTILERNQEIAHRKLKDKLLGSFTVSNGIIEKEFEVTNESASDSCADSHTETGSDITSFSQADSAASEPLPQKNLKAQMLLPKIKRRKRGRPSKAEIQALEARMAAAIKMGVKSTNCIIQNKSPATSAPTTPKAAEKRPRAKNVVDKNTLDSMSEREVSLNHLKSSVNTYFGAANRLAAGEGFRVLARRISSEGRVQYLVEWEGGIIG